MASSTSYPDRDDRRYIAAVMAEPILEREQEAGLARRWRDDEDQDALHEIVRAHIRLVVRIAARFRGYGLPLADLIQEGTAGLLEAGKRFDPEREVRFSTYATWWILAAIQEYIVRNASIVRIGTTPAQKSLFFNLRKLRARLKSGQGAVMSDEDRQSIADQLGVPKAAVERMEAHLMRPDRSLNATIGTEDSDELMDFLADDAPSPEETVTDLLDGKTRADWLYAAMETLTPREQQIIRRRFLEDERTTLAEIGETLGVTKERVRQIESKALGKLRVALGDKIESEELFAA